MPTARVTYHYRLERDKELVNSRASRWKKILIATDFSPTARVALRSAVNLSQQVGGTIEVVHVVEPLKPPYTFLLEAAGAPSLEEMQIERGEKHLERLLRLVGSGRAARHGFVRRGKPWKEILAAAEELETDLICLGNSGHSHVERLLLGSTAENVVRRSSIPVLVSRKKPLGRVRRLLVPIDFEEGSMNALRFALARFPEDVVITALYAIPPLITIDPQILNYYADHPRVERDMRAFLDRLGAERARHEVAMFEDAAAAIVDRAESSRADLTLLSTQGRRGVARYMLGSVSEKVIRYSERPVLVLPGPSQAKNK
jgi:nucleotide-binding universal stress UspA family protein